ncbi:MAG: hypothetical protein ACK40K_06590, partial [Raineya sp.]
PQPTSSWFPTFCPFWETWQSQSEGSIGTFGGEVVVIDYVNTKDNKYRVLVLPDKNDRPWPTSLRIGTGTYGWFMLRDVPIWYEIWRQLNGFPPSLDEEPRVKDEYIPKNIKEQRKSKDDK